MLKHHSSLRGVVALVLLCVSVSPKSPLVSPATATGPNGYWSLLSPPIPITAYHSTVYDPVRDRMIVVGELLDKGNILKGVVWALSFADSSTWTKIVPAGTSPPPRTYHSAIYDPVRDRIIVYGGWWTGPDYSDVWALNLAGTPTWEQLAPTGIGPGARGRHTAVYDPVRDRMIVYGGRTSEVSAGTYPTDCWALPL